MSRRTVQLVERRTREVRLPPADVAFLLAHARHVIEVVPAFQSGVYRITPRGFVGWLDTPTRRFAIAPKIPWPNVRMLLGLPPQDEPGGTAIAPDAGLLNVLAGEFAAQLREVARIGFIAGYREHDTTGAFLRGKLRAADQMRDAAARAFPDRFHVSESVLDLDTPWNRIPKAIAEQLLAHPELEPRSRIEIRDAARVLHDVPLTPVTDADFAAAEAEPRAAHYRSLLALCRLLNDAFAATQLGASGHAAFLIDLSRAFERYLAEGLVAVMRPGWSLEAQAGFAVGPTTLRPDILLRRRGESRVVLDAKWKSPGTIPDAADLHQILAYAAITGARQVGLVYPGRRFARREFTVAERGIRVSLFRAQVVGTTGDCSESLARLARFVCRNRR